jgi:DNA-binding MarR family transcriptional regulator
MQTKELSSSLRLVITALHKGLRNKLSPVSVFSMTEVETIALLVRNKQMLPSELASLTRVKTQSMSQIINKMQGMGVIKRTPSKEDKRKVYISLTKSGKKMVEKTRYERDEWLRKAIEQSLGEKEKDVLTKAIPVLNKLLDHI